MKRIPTIKVVMTPFPYSIDIEAPLHEGRELMEAHDIRHLPVSAEGQLVGVLSDRDLKRAADPGRGVWAEEMLLVRHVYVPEAYIVDLNERLDQVALSLAEQHVGSALVVKEGKLVGIFTTTDACRCLGELLRQEFSPGDDDEVA